MMNDERIAERFHLAAFMFFNVSLLLPLTVLLWNWYCSTVQERLVPLNYRYPVFSRSFWSLDLMDTHVHAEFLTPVYSCVNHMGFNWLSSLEFSSLFVLLV